MDGSWKQLEPLFGNPHRPPLTIGPPERRARSFPMPKRGNVKDEPDDGKAELEVRHRECHITSRLFAHTEVHEEVHSATPSSCQTLSRERASFTSLTRVPLPLSLASLGKPISCRRTSPPPLPPASSTIASTIVSIVAESRSSTAE